MQMAVDFPNLVRFSNSQILRLQKSRHEAVKNVEEKILSGEK